jgi:hypothetical protein
MAYLDDHPPVRSQFRDPRRQSVSGVVVVHTAESVMDMVGPDTGAEGVAHFITVRDTPGSYHELVDSDSYINVVRWTCEAFHDGTGSNPHSFGLSFACRTTDWATMGDAKVTAFLERGAQRAAAYARWCRTQHGIIIPSTRITRDESDRKVPGFISHGQRDPGRRTDPGQEFPWALFLARFKALTDGVPIPPTTRETDDVFTYERTFGSNAGLVCVAAGKQVRWTGNDLLLECRSKPNHYGKLGQDEWDRLDKAYGVPS